MLAPLTDERCNYNPMVVYDYQEIEGLNFVQFYKKDLITSLKIKTRNTSTPTMTSFRYFLRN